MLNRSERPTILVILAFFLAASVLTFFYVRNQPLPSTPDNEPQGFFADRFNSDRSATPDENAALTSEPGTRTANLQHDGLTRTYYIHVPRGYDPEQAHPLVFLLHGGGGNGQRILEQTDMASKADAVGFILVAPEGVDGNWNDGLREDAKTNTEHIANVDDIDFFTSLLAQLSQQYSIDSDRVYATGMSNGGQMSQHLACELPNTFAAIGPVASPMREPYDRSCPNPHPTPVIGVQGTEDPFLPIYDDDGLPELPRVLANQGIQQTPITLDELTAFWRTVNECSNDPVVTNQPDQAGDGTSVDVYRFNDCATGMPVEYHIVNGAGHGWPPSSGANGMTARISGPSSNNIITNDVVWEFFSQHSR